MPFKPFPAMQVGSEATDASGNKTVTFPTPFSAAPKVFLQGDDASGRGIVLDKYDVTTTGFKVKARKVTGITSGSGGVNHTHPIGSPSTTTVLVGMHYHHGAVAAKYDHTHTTGAPSTTATVASSTHTHTTPLIGGVTTANTGYDTAYSVGSYSSVANLGDAYTSNVGRLYRYQETRTETVAQVRHKHNLSHVHPAGYTTSTPSATATVASSTHTHTTGGPSTTQDVVTDLYTEPEDFATVVNGIPSGTDGASAYSHTHSVGAPVLAINFDYLAIGA